jgi:hypothetical protein
VVLLAFTRHDDVVHISEDVAANMVFKDLLGEAGESRTDVHDVTPLVLLSLKLEHNIMSISISCVCHT